MSRLLPATRRAFSLLLSSLLLLTLASLIVTPAAYAQAPVNGLTVDNGNPTAATGVVTVLGVADHPTFRKWQLDLLVNGAEPIFLALGEQPLTNSALLAELDTRLYPDGEHRLRLRVVYANLNYDEYFLPIRIANQSGSTVSPAVPSQPATPNPQPVAPPPSPPPAPAVTGNGLSVAAQGGLLSVRGVADHPTFHKWQLDLLLYGDPNQAAFLAVGEEPVAVPAELISFSGTDYPAGSHQLRLRVVYLGQNYDEYLLPLTIGVGNFATSGQNPLLVHGPAAGKAVYLTFDDGPHSDHTPKILEVLAEYNAKATFFVVGSHAQSQGELLKQIYDAGHAIGNHSWSHRKLGHADWDTFEAEVGTTEKMLGSYGRRCLRPPYGDVGKQFYANAKKAGYTIVWWSVDPLDWLNQNPETIASRVLKQVQPGAIVLLHDGGDSREGTIEALRKILAALSAEGYTFPALCR